MDYSCKCEAKPSRITSAAPKNSASLRVPSSRFTVASPFQLWSLLVLFFGFALFVLSFLTLVLFTAFDK
jgi:hypothetical protein